MPIKFRCVYCDKLLGIARRKAGTVVNCTECGQPLIVPSPEPEPAPVAARPTGSGGKVFESDDFDVILQGDATLPATAPPRPAPPPARPMPPQTFPAERNLPAPRPAVEPMPAAGIVLTTTKLILMFIAVVFLVATAFVAGFLVGKMSVSG